MDYDRHFEIGCPAAKAAIEQAAAAVSECKWSTSVHDHSFMITEALHGAFDELVPRVRKKVRPCFIADATWKCFIARNEERHEQRRAIRQAKHAWDEEVKESLLRASAVHKRAANYLSGTIQRMVEQDKKVYLEGAIGDASRLGPARGLSAIQGALRPFVARKGGKKVAAKPLPLLEDDNGNRATCKKDRADLFAVHFAGQELGEKATLSDIAARAVARQDARAATLGNLEVRAEDAISLLEYGSAVCNANPNKAVGLDAVALKLARADERRFMRLTYPLILKQTLCISEPVQAKGGELLALFKKGLMSRVAHYRSVMLGDSGPKCYQGAIRAKIVSRLEGAGGYRDQACSGRKGRGADLAALGARSFARLLKRKGWSGALFFWDLRAAYHKVVRQLVFGQSLYASDEEVAHLIRRLGLPPETMQELADHVQEETGLMEQEGVCWHLARLVEESHTSTFFLVAGAEAPYETHRGGRPGSPFADLIHHFLLSRIMKEIEGKCGQLGKLTELEWDGERSVRLPGAGGCVRRERVLELSVADDVVELLAVDSAERNKEHIAAFARETYKYFVGFGADPNLDPGKTNVMPFFSGPGAAEARRDLLISDGGIIRFSCAGIQREVNCTLQYTHVGGVVCSNEDMGPEVRRHIGSLWGSLRKYDKVLSRNKWLQFDAKVAMTKSVSLVHLEWNCHVWPPLACGHLKNKTGKGPVPRA